MTLEKHIYLFIIFFVVLWLAYANLMIIYHKFYHKMPKGIRNILLYGLGVPFIIADVIFNIIYGSIMFLELPNISSKTHFKFMPTFTERCADHLEAEWNKEDKSWRFKLARLICHYLLEPWDPNHCGLKALREASYIKEIAQ